MQSLVGTFFIIKQELICFTLMAYISFLWYFSIITDRFVSFPRYYFIILNQIVPRSCKTEKKVEKVFFGNSYLKRFWVNNTVLRGFPLRGFPLHGFFELVQKDLYNTIW